MSSKRSNSSNERAGNEKGTPRCRPHRGSKGHGGSKGSLASKVDEEITYDGEGRQTSSKRKTKDLQQNTTLHLIKKGRKRLH